MCANLPPVDAIYPGWVLHEDDTTAHAVAWQGVSGPPFEYGIVCGYLDGTKDWKPADYQVPRCPKCRRELAALDRLGRMV